MRKQFCRMSGILMLLTIAICMSLSVLRFVHAAGPKMSIKIRNGKRTVAVGKKLDLKASICHKRRGAKLIWKSSSRKIATVSKYGMVSGKKAGMVKITARIRGTSVKRICKIRVTKKEKNTTGQKAPQPQKTFVSAQKPGSCPGSSSMHRPGTGSAGKDSGMVDGSSLPTGTPGQDGEIPTDFPVATTPEPGNVTRTPKPGNVTKTPEPGSVTTQEPEIPTISPEPGISPDRKELVPYSVVMEIQGELTTVFLVNKNYEGQVHVRINGKEFTAQGSVKDAIFLLAYGGTARTDSSNRIRLSRTVGQDGMLDRYWILEDLELGESYRMGVDTRNTVIPSFAYCGVIYFPGDVTSAIEVY